MRGSVSPRAPSGFGALGSGLVGARSDVVGFDARSSYTLRKQRHGERVEGHALQLGAIDELRVQASREPQTELAAGGRLDRSRRQ